MMVMANLIAVKKDKCVSCHEEIKIGDKIVVDVCDEEAYHTKCIKEINK